LLLLRLFCISFVITRAFQVIAAIRMQDCLWPLSPSLSVIIFPSFSAIAVQQVCLINLLLAPRGCIADVLVFVCLALVLWTFPGVGSQKIGNGPQRGTARRFFQKCWCFFGPPGKWSNEISTRYELKVKLEQKKKLTQRKRQCCAIKTWFQGIPMKIGQKLCDEFENGGQSVRQDPLFCLFFSYMDVFSLWKEPAATATSSSPA
jgi:hypothetical protein